jgi:gliding motility-associated-like protein
MLNITADTIHKKYGNILAGNSGSTAFTSTGLQNNESIGSVTMAYGNGSAAITPVGIYTGSVIPSLASGGSFNPNNYTISYTPGNIIIDPVDLTITADNKTKVFGADNPLLTVTYSGFVNNENAVVLNPGPTISTTAVATSPVGSYPITANSANAQNYIITYVAGVLTINPVHIQLIIPNAFTPNGDGINDTWQIQHIESFPNCTVFVYNRYGEVVLSSTGYGIPWDGTYKGSALPSGTYYYLIDTKTNTKMISGWVAIIR